MSHLYLALTREERANPLIINYINNIFYTDTPFFIAVKLFLLINFFIDALNHYGDSYNAVIYCLGGLLYNIISWFHALDFETVYLGRHTIKVRAALTAGFALFLLSEIALFAGFFWTYFDRIFYPSFSSFNTTQLNGFELIRSDLTPFLATAVLVASGYLANFAYYLFLVKNPEAQFFLTISWLLAFLFLGLQIEEYLHLTLNISNGILGSIFFILTGFHGAHVMVGTIFLTYSLIDLLTKKIIPGQNIGFSLSIIYWHFVDIIWVFLFIFIYVLNNHKILDFLGLISIFSIEFKVKFAWVTGGIFWGEYWNVEKIGLLDDSWRSCRRFRY